MDAHTAQETLRLAEQAGVAKAHLSWLDLTVKSFIGGIFISLGGGFDLVVAGGSPGLRTSNSSLSTLLSALVFPVGFVLIMLTNMELSTSNFFTMAYSTLRRRTSLWDLARNWVVSYLGNISGCLFYAGILCHWADVLSSDDQRAWASTQAEGRVNINWGYNFTRGIMCNWLVGMAFFFATQARDNLSKMAGIWVAILPFVAMGYQHSVVNYFMVPIGMFYGTNFGVGKFIWASAIPVTLGNIVGGAGFGAFLMWVVYGRHEGTVRREEKPAEDSDRV
jgi:formate/nitrite transporter